MNDQVIPVVSARGNPVLQVRGSSVLIYEEPDRIYSSGKSLKRILNMRRQQYRAYSGGVTQGMRKRMAKAITIMTQAIKPKYMHNPVTGRLFRHHFSFITLTIASQKNLTAREAYDQVFNHFLDWLTRTEGVDTYIWKAEEQKRGQIHYHITCPNFIHYLDIRRVWNNLQRKAGLLEEYAKKHGHFDPNSTDIHETYNVRHADKYLLKELNKTLNAKQVEAIAEVKAKVTMGDMSIEEADQEIERIYQEKICTLGKVWGCSENLQGVGYFKVGLRTGHMDTIEQWVKEGKAREKTDQYFALIFCDECDPSDLLNTLEKVKMTEYLNWVLTRNQPDG